MERSRRQRELIEVAARQFAARGYHDVGIGDITGELGLTAPAFYRHYPTKEALLIDVLDAAIMMHLEQAGALVARSTGPQQALEALIAHHLDFVFDETDSIVTWRTEFRILRDHDHHRLRYLQRLYTEEWVRTVGRLRPDLPVEEVRTMVHGVIAALQSPTQFFTQLPREDVVAVLTTMALSALGLVNANV